MATDTTEPPATSPVEQTGPLLRTAADAEHDLAETVSNLVNKVYQEWPNDAGFEGLTEERGPIELTVAGSIPEWAAGSLYRTGPGARLVENTPDGDYKFDHWFDGLAHTHRFDIIPPASSAEPVRVTYSSRRQSEKMVKHFQKHGTKGNVTFGQKADPCLGFLGKLMATYKVYSRTDIVTNIHADNIGVAVHLNPPGLPDLRNKANTSNGASNGTTNGTTNGAKKVSAPTTNGGHRGSPSTIPKVAWVSTDTAIMKQIDPTTLEPIGTARQSVLHPSLKGPLSAAHAQHDPLTGDMINFNLEMSKSAIYRIFRIDGTTGQTDILATLKGPRAKAAYIHSMFLSENYIILCIPCSHIGWNGAKIPWCGNVVEALEPFSTSKRTVWYVIDRKGEAGKTKGVVAEFESDAGFFFHTVNAYEERDEKTGDVEIVCDVVEFDNFDIIKSMYYDSLLDRNGEREQFSTKEQLTKIMPRLVRHRLALGEAKGGAGVKRTQKVFSIPGPHAGELPTINPAFATRKHRYVYAIANRGLSTLSDGLVKTDTETRGSALWAAPKGHTPGEPIFVGRPGAGEEDDGVLLSVVLDGFGKSSYLLCLDAQTMKELGRADVGIAVGFGFHGTHHLAAL